MAATKSSSCSIRNAFLGLKRVRPEILKSRPASTSVNRLLRNVNATFQSGSSPNRNRKNKLTSGEPISV